jgi:hypothetical protein
MIKTYTTKIEEANDEDIYNSHKKGKREGDFKPMRDFKDYIRLESRVNYHDNQSKATAGMLKEALEINGIKGTDSEIGNIYKMFDNMEVILKGEEVHAMQFGALGKYVTAYLDATQIYHGKLPDGFAPDGTWYKNENGVYVRDMKKVAELIL